MDLKKVIRNIPDFPKPGIQFKDITPLLGDRAALAYTVQELARPFVGQKIDYVVGLESRGFIFGSAVAHELAVGFIPVRRPGKLPYKTLRQEYALEYGTNTLEIHQDALPANSRVLIIDDLLATGGTADAAQQLVKKLAGNVIGFAFVIELDDLNGRRRLHTENVHTLIHY